MGYKFKRHSAIIVSILTILSVASPAFADCESAKQKAEQTVSQLQSKIQGAGACQASKYAIQALQANIEYLDSCPSADPDGSHRQAIMNSLNGARNTASQICG